MKRIFLSSVGLALGPVFVVVGCSGGAVDGTGGATTSTTQTTTSTTQAATSTSQVTTGSSGVTTSSATTASTTTSVSATTASSSTGGSHIFACGTTTTCDASSQYCVVDSGPDNCVSHAPCPNSDVTSCACLNAVQLNCISCTDTSGGPTLDCPGG